MLAFIRKKLGIALSDFVRKRSNKLKSPLCGEPDEAGKTSKADHFLIGDAYFLAAINIQMANKAVIMPP